jgi:hypothetical protein
MAADGRCPSPLGVAGRDVWDHRAPIAVFIHSAAARTTSIHGMIDPSSKRVGDDLDRRFQRLDPLVTIPGMNVLPSVARQISFDVLFDGRMPFGGPGVSAKGVEVRGEKPSAVVANAPRWSPMLFELTPEGFGLREWSNDVAPSKGRST